MSEDGPSHEHHDFEWDDVYSGDTSDYAAPDPWFLTQVDSLPVGRALDVGCGAGGLVSALVERGWQTTGIDVAKTAIAAATAVLDERGLEATLVVADGTEWIPPERYDLVTNSFALPTTKDERAAVFRMMREALAPGGTLLLKEHDAVMTRLPHFAPYDLVTVEELRAAFADFHVVRAATEEYDAEVQYRSDPEVPERWVAALVQARKGSEVAR